MMPMAVSPVVRAAIVGSGVAENIAVTLRAQDRHGTVVVSPVTAVLPRSGGAPGAL